MTMEQEAYLRELLEDFGQSCAGNGCYNRYWNGSDDGDGWGRIKEIIEFVKEINKDKNYKPA